MKPVEVRRERIVSLPIEVVWQIIEPAITVPSWLPLADRVELLSGKGLGRRQRMHAKWGGRQVAIEQVVTAYTPEALLTWKHVDEKTNGKTVRQLSKEVTLSVRLESIGPGTRVVLESRNVPASATAGVLLRLVAKKRIGKGFDRALAKLAAAGD